jgi:hypothetical protein
MQSVLGPFGMRGATAYPCQGAWQDQPAKLMDAFAALDAMVDRKEPGES